MGPDFESFFIFSIDTRQLVPCVGAYLLYGTLSQQWLDLIKLAYNPSRTGPLTASTFKLS